MPDPLRQVRGLVCKFTLQGFGGAPSNDGEIHVSPDGLEADEEVLYLTGPGTNPILTVTIEQFISRVNAIYRSYCYGVPLTFTVRDGDPLPQIISVDMPI